MTRILVIDDEPLQLDLIADRIEMEFAPNSVIIDKTPNLHTAQALLDQNTYNLIITDLMMGEHNAKDSVKEISEKYQAPIIVYTVAPESFPNEYYDHKHTFLMDKLKPFEEGMIDLVNHLVGNKTSPNLAS